MPLISNQLNGLYGGVNQQSAEQRLPTQVEEMVNAYPTLDRGLLKRNPTEKLTLTDAIDYNKDMWVYEYDRGLAGDSEEKYSVQITDDGMNIINVVDGQVYNKGNGKLIFTATEDEDYLQPFVNGRGYSAVTIKDTTFLANKNVQPILDPYITGGASGGASTVDVNQDIIWFNKVPSKSADVPLSEGGLTTVYQKDYAPASLAQEVFTEGVEVRLGASSTTITIDSIYTAIYVKPEEILGGINIIPIDPTNPLFVYYHNTTITYNEYLENVKNKVIESLDPSIYIVDIITDATRKGIRIKKVDGSPTLVTTTGITINSISPKHGGTLTPLWTAVEADYYNTTASSSYTEDIIIPPSTYLQEGYIWIKSSNPTSGYTYSFSIQSDTTTYSNNVTNTTTEGAATAIVALIDAQANFSAQSVGGSVLQITTSDGADLINIYVGDTFGDQASYGWSGEVVFNTDLPKNMPYQGALVKVIGSNANPEESYWLEYTLGQWREALGYNTQPIISAQTMPHTLTRNADDTFTFEAYDQWSDKLVGDDDSNPAPSFTQDGNVIKDIFFFKNRLGFITNRTVIFSEVGGYGNFWRTTVATLLDSDRIDTTVDTTKAIQLEYATYLEDSLMLFSDKAQFKLEGGNVLSPKSIQISQTSAYEINKNIRPIFMNDKIFFCAKRGDYTAVMQYSVTGDGRISEAVDISGHIQSYIPQDVTRLSGSPINNMLFLTSNDLSDTIFVYKYFDNGGERVQSAWFKWTYNGQIYSSFSLGKNLNILINRLNPVAVTNWIVGSGIWDMSKVWDNSQLWVMSPDSLVGQDQFEVSSIFPQDYIGQFLDDFTTADNETIIPTVVKIGEWVASSGGTKDIRGHLKFKTAQISSEEGSDFSLMVEDIARGTMREIKSKYTVGRKPMIYGDAKNIRISVTNANATGFRINTVSYEGALTKRDSRR